jgi:DNA-binding MarR family transcriptional regulator
MATARVLPGTAPGSEELVAEALVTASRAFRHCLWPELERERLTSPMFWALNQLVWDGPMNVSRIAGACGVTSANVSSAVEGLQRAGLVVRRAAADRRVVSLAPTARGRAVHRAIWKGIARSLARSFHGVPASDLRVTAEVLGRVAHVPGLPEAMGEVLE